VDYTTTNSSSPTTTKPEPDIYWKAKFKDEGIVKILPEAPLWGVEKELCRRDKQMWDAVKRPPPTGMPKSSTKPKRNKPVRPVSGEFNSGRLHVGGRRGSFIDTSNEKYAARRSTGGGLEKNELRIRPRSKSRPRSVEFERESVIREEMPHRGQKDKTWWEGVAEGIGMKSVEVDRREEKREERREKENIRFEDEGYGTREKERDTVRGSRIKDERRSSKVYDGVNRSPRRSSMRV
jgi:hypothetical protein